MVSLNKSEKVKAVTLAFCSIQKHFIRDVRAKYGTSNLPQSPDIGKNSDRIISNFRISDQSLINRNCHNSRTSDNIDMKLEPVTKLDKRNKSFEKFWRWSHVWKFWCHCHFFNLRPIWNNPKAGFSRPYILVNSNLLSYKNWKQN